jgi:hypothetical protein
MRKNTRRIAFAAVMAAMSVVFLYFASIFPSGQLGFVAVASLFVIAAVIESGIAGGVSVFAAVSILGFLIVPAKGVMFLYLLFFGYYPVLKSLIEKISKPPVELILKLAVFNAALSVLWFAFSGLVFDGSFLGGNLLIVYILGNIAFLLYDFGVTKLIAFYLSNISSKLKIK